MLADPRKSRYSLFPIVHTGLWRLYKQAIASFWTVEEIDMQEDRVQYELKLNGDERAFVEKVLGFFANVDSVVIHNISSNFIDRAEEYGFPPEATAFYSYQVYNESIHGETYSQMIDSLVRSAERKDELYNAIVTDPAVRRIADWIGEWVMADGLTSTERLVGMACVEAVMFSAAFCSIYWLRKRGLMPGLCFANELIARDEGLHASFAAEMIRVLGGCDPEVATRIIRSAVAAQEDFVRDSLPVRLIGLSADAMIEYVQFVADRLAVDLGCEKVFGTENPFDWMEQISLNGKTNFFEKRVGDYQKSGVMQGRDTRIDASAFAGDADF